MSVLAVPGTLGSLDEAKEIFAAVGDRWKNVYQGPEGWTFAGSGRSRDVWLNPSKTVVYKICHVYSDDEPSYNELEAWNIDFIRANRRLPDGWLIPDYQLYKFNYCYTQWDKDHRKGVARVGRVVILAMEYVDGVAFTYADEGHVRALFSMHSVVKISGKLAQE